jgi:hypothetical protein
MSAAKGCPRTVRVEPFDDQGESEDSPLRPRAQDVLDRYAEWHFDRHATHSTWLPAFCLHRREGRARERRVGIRHNSQTAGKAVGPDSPLDDDPCSGLAAVPDLP